MVEYVRDRSKFLPRKLAPEENRQHSYIVSAMVFTAVLGSIVTAVFFFGWIVAADIAMACWEPPCPPSPGLAVSTIGNFVFDYIEV